MATTSVAIDRMSPADWEEVRRIYLEGIATGNATFETAAPEWAKWDADHRGEPRLVARDGDRLVGWASLTPVSDRCVYGGVAEVSVYVSQETRGRGVGRMLLEALVRESEDTGIWTLQAGVFPENAASVAIHKKCRCRLVPVREKLGRLSGRWRDVLLLERRSTRTGLEG